MKRGEEMDALRGALSEMMAGLNPGVAQRAAGAPYDDDELELPPVPEPPPTPPEIP